jgi:hypothetical protein
MKRTPHTLAALGLALALLACSGKTYKTVPDPLIGVWMANSSKYEDRYLELRRSELVLGTGEGTTSSHRVLKVKETQENSQTVYTVYYHGEAGEEVLTFQFNAAAGTIQIKNQKDIIWKKGTLETTQE